jgi:structural maintenance of chromosome 1
MPADPSPAPEVQSHMGGRIARIDTENFKSYGGKRTIGPFLGFSAVVGPNGAGAPAPRVAVAGRGGVGPSPIRPPARA